MTPSRPMTAQQMRSEAARLLMFARDYRKARWPEPADDCERDAARLSAEADRLEAEQETVAQAAMSLASFALVALMLCGWWIGAPT